MLTTFVVGEARRCFPALFRPGSDLASALEDGKGHQAYENFKYPGVFLPYFTSKWHRLVQKANTGKASDNR